jgi:hypothetical protein
VPRSAHDSGHRLASMSPYDQHAGQTTGPPDPGSADPRRDERLLPQPHRGRQRHGAATPAEGAAPRTPAGSGTTRVRPNLQEVLVSEEAATRLATLVNGTNTGGTGRTPAAPCAAQPPPRPDAGRLPRCGAHHGVARRARRRAAEGLPAVSRRGRVAGRSGDRSRALASAPGCGAARPPRPWFTPKRW